MNTNARKFSSESLPADDWEVRFTKQVVRTIAHYRDLRGLTTEQLAARCSDAYGEPGKVKGNTLNGLFAGKRKSIGVAEILMFAEALKVTPIFLMLPIAAGDDVEISPRETVHSFEAYRRMVAPMPALYMIRPQDDVEHDHSVILDAFERHDAALLRLGGLTSDWLSALQAESAGKDLPADWQDKLREQSQTQIQLLGGLRFMLKTKGATPPPIPETLMFLDQEPLPNVPLPLMGLIGDSDAI